MTFWENVENLRAAQNTSYRWISHVTNISETTISSMRHSGTEPRASDAIKIAKALNTSVEFLCNQESDIFYNKYNNLKETLEKIVKNL